MNTLTSKVRFGHFYGGICPGAQTIEERQFVSREIKGGLSGSALDIYKGMSRLLFLGAHIPSSVVTAVQKAAERLQCSISAKRYAAQITSEAEEISETLRSIILLRGELASLEPEKSLSEPDMKHIQFNTFMAVMYVSGVSAKRAIQSPASSRSLKTVGDVLSWVNATVPYLMSARRDYHASLTK